MRGAKTTYGIEVAFAGSCRVLAEGQLVLSTRN